MKKNYSAPSIEVLNVEIEKGFATSGGSIPQQNDYAAAGACGMLNEGGVYNL